MSNINAGFIVTITNCFVYIPESSYSHVLIKLNVRALIHPVTAIKVEFPLQYGIIADLLQCSSNLHISKGFSSYLSGSNSLQRGNISFSSLSSLL